MSNESNNTNENPKTAANAEASESKESKLDKFSKTAAAATISGAMNQAAGQFKQKFGEITGDSLLKETGQEQLLTGKAHRLVGKIRGIRETAQGRITDSRNEGIALWRKHCGKLIDATSDLVDDLKKL